MRRRFGAKFVDQSFKQSFYILRWDFFLLWKGTLDKPECPTWVEIFGQKWEGGERPKNKCSKEAEKIKGDKFAKIWRAFPGISALNWVVSLAWWLMVVTTSGRYKKSVSFSPNYRVPLSLSTCLRTWMEETKES